MKYTAQANKYVLRNFLYIFPFAVLPALFLSLSTDEGALIEVLEAFFHGKAADWTFSSLFRAISILNFASWQSVVFGIIGIIVIVPCVALMMALLEKHFRIGKRTFNGLWSKLNDNFISTCGYVFLFLTIYEIWSLLTAAILFLMSMLGNFVVSYVLVTLFFLAMHVLLLYVVGALYLWLPCMQITGFRSFEALHYSYHLVMPVKWKILFGQMFFLFISEALIGLCALFIPNPWVFIALTAFLYAYMIMIFCVRMQIVYFDRDHIQRADLAYYYRR